MEAGMINRVIRGKRYWLVPSIHSKDVSGSCDYCTFVDSNGGCHLIDNSPLDDKRYGDSHLAGCNPPDEAVDFIFIKRTKAAMAEYVAHKLEGV
jgi:hypothetical protein